MDLNSLSPTSPPETPTTLLSCTPQAKMDISNLRGCRTCQKVFPIDEFMSPDRNRIFKMCTACRTIARDRCRLSKAEKKATEQHEREQIMAEVEYLRAIHNIGSKEPTATLGHSISGRSIWSGRGAHESTPTSPQNGDTSPEPSGDDETTETLRKEDSSQEASDTRNSHSKDTDLNDTGGSSSRLSTIEYISTESPEPAFFMCLHCGTPRGYHLSYDSICVYCMEQYKFCVVGWHEEVISSFIGKNGTEYATCKECRGNASEDESVEELISPEKPVEQSVAEKAPAIEEDLLIKQEPDDDPGRGIREIRALRNPDGRAERKRAFTGWRGMPEIIVIED